MGRTVEDVRLLFEVLAGYDVADPFSVPIGLRPAELEGVKIGLVEQFPMEPEIRAAVLEAAAMLGGAEPFEFAGFGQAHQCWDFFFNVLSDPLKREIMAVDPGLAHWTGLELLQDPPADPSGVEVVKQFAVRDKLRVALLQQMEETPVLLLPSCSVTAFLPRERNWKGVSLLEAMSCLTPFNLFGMPGLTVPMRVSAGGLPIGVQLVGRPYSEELLLAMGEKLEQVRGAFPCVIS